MIAEIGFENIRMRMVAERAGVSTAALHYHFDTRENLFAEALHYSFDHTGADVYEARGSDDTATARLARIISASLPADAEPAPRVGDVAGAVVPRRSRPGVPHAGHRALPAHTRAGSRRPSRTASRRASSRPATPRRTRSWSARSATASACS